MTKSYQVKVHGVFCGKKVESFVKRVVGNLKDVMSMFSRHDAINKVIFTELDNRGYVVRVHVLEVSETEDNTIKYEAKEYGSVVAFNSYVGFDMMDLIIQLIDDLETKIA
jgi:hypothetical protein